jgi:hypothetical protein
MKKGFILTLLTAVVMVTLVLSASANAPLVGPLPTVILGNTEEIEGAGGETLWRDLDVANLLDTDVATQWITWNNTDTTQFHVYYIADTTGSATVQASTPAALVAGLSATEYQALEASGTAPAAANDILDGNAAGTLALINTAATSGTVASAAAADPAANGMSVADATTAGVLGTSVLRLVAAVDSSTGFMALGVGDLAVTSTADVADSVSTISYAVDRAAANDTLWRDQTPGSGGGIEAATLSASPKVGFVVSADPAAGNLMYGSWILTEEAIVGTGLYQDWRIKASSADLPAGSFFLASYQMRSNSTSASDCPGYRLFAANENFTHFAALLVDTPDDAQSGFAGQLGEVNAPYDTQDFVANLAWAPHRTALDMSEAAADQQWQWDAGGVAEDQRDYTIMFELLNLGHGDTGELELVNYSVRTIAEADLGTAVATADFDTFDEWTAVAHTFAGFGQGHVVVGATSTDLGTGAGEQPAWPVGALGGTAVASVGLGLDVDGGVSEVGRLAVVNAPTGFTLLNGGALLPHADNQIVISSLTVAGATDEDSTAPIRFFVYSVSNDGDGDGVEGEGQLETWGAETNTDFASPQSMIWIDATGAFEDYGKSPFFKPGGAQDNPGTPPSAGTTLKSYIHTHSARPNDNAPKLFPQVQVLSSNNYVGSGTWVDDNGDITIQQVVMNAYPAP